MLLPNRTDDAGSDYRYSFQGQEKDNEIKGDNNSVNYKYRMHDPRVGRFFAVDPLAKQYPHNGPYNFSENRVIDGIELEGAEYLKIIHVIDTKAKLEVERIEIDYTGETPFGTYYEESFGSEGRGVKHMYSNTEGQPIAESRWDLHQSGYLSRGGIACHGFYQGSGCVTYTGYGDYDFTREPIDDADWVAYQHDMDYDEFEGDISYLEDVRTLYADETMLARLGYLKNSKDFEGYSQETQKSIDNALTAIGAMAEYKRRKISTMQKRGLDINSVEDIESVNWKAVVHKFSSLYYTLYLIAPDDDDVSNGADDRKWDSLEEQEDNSGN